MYHYLHHSSSSILSTRSRPTTVDTASQNNKKIRPFDWTITSTRNSKLCSERMCVIYRSSTIRRNLKQIFVVDSQLILSYFIAPYTWMHTRCLAMADDGFIPSHHSLSVFAAGEGFQRQLMEMHHFQLPICCLWVAMKRARFS